MARFSMPDERAILATLERVAAVATAPYHEWRALDAIAAELERIGLTPTRDRYGQLLARRTSGSAVATLGTSGPLHSAGLKGKTENGAPIARPTIASEVKWFGSTFATRCSKSIDDAPDGRGPCQRDVDREARDRDTVRVRYIEPDAARAISESSSIAVSWRMRGG